MVDCEALGAAISDYIGIGSDGLYEGACEIGISAAAGALLQQLDSLDQTGMVLTIDGQAPPIISCEATSTPTTGSTSS